MRAVWKRAARLGIVAALLGLALVPIGAEPAGANHEEWGFSTMTFTQAPAGYDLYSNRFPHGRGIEGFPRRQISLDEYDGTNGEIQFADNLCFRGRTFLVDPRGRYAAIAEPSTALDYSGYYPDHDGFRWDLQIPLETPPGPYFLKLSCNYGTSALMGVPSGGLPVIFDSGWRLPDGNHWQSICADFEVLAPRAEWDDEGTYFDIFMDEGPALPLRSDPCPRSLWSVVGHSVDRFGFGGRSVFDAWRMSISGAGSASTTTTTTTGASPTRSAPDRTAPSIPGAAATPATIWEQDAPGTCTNVPGSVVTSTVSVRPLDESGIASVTMSWSGPASGSKPMTGGPSYTATFGPFPASTIGPGTAEFLVTITARDNAGNIGTISLYARLNDCEPFA